MFTEPNISLVVKNEYQTDLSIISSIRPYIDNSYWICCTNDSVLQKIESNGVKLRKISKHEIKVYGIRVLSSYDVLLATRGLKLKKLTLTTGEMTDTAYDVSPLFSTTIHITSGNIVVVGGMSKKIERSAVFVMNEQGEHETVYEYV